MGLIKQKFKVEQHITVPTGAAQSLADLLGMDLTSAGDLERRVSNVLLLAHPNNGALIFVGESDVASNKCFPLGADRIIELNPDDTSADEDIGYIDLNEVFVLSGTVGQVLIVAELEEVSSTY